MSKLKKATPADISAMLSNAVVVRKFRNQVVLSTVTVPRKSKSVKKQEAIDRFKSANRYAKWILKEPGMRDLYAKGIDDKKSNAHTVALADYLNAPEIHYVKMKGYTGAVGDELRIKATDDFQVTAVVVSILSKKGKVLETGPAVRYGRKPAIWVYTTTVINVELEGTIIRVTAEDRPGNMVVHEVRMEGDL